MKTRNPTKVVLFSFRSGVLSCVPPPPPSSHPSFLFIVFSLQLKKKTRKVFIGGVAAVSREADVREVFEKHGKVSGSFWSFTNLARRKRSAKFFIVVLPAASLCPKGLDGLL